MGIPWVPGSADWLELDELADAQSGESDSIFCVSSGTQWVCRVLLRCLTGRMDTQLFHGGRISSVLVHWSMIQDRSGGSCAWKDGVRSMCIPQQCEKRSGYRSGQDRHLILRLIFLLSSHARQSAFRSACTLACDYTEWLKWRRRSDVFTSWNVASVWKLLPTGLPEPQTTLANLKHSQLVNSAMNHCSYLIHRSLIFAFFSKSHESAMLLLGILIWRTRKT